MPKLNLRTYLIFALFAIILFSPIPTYSNPKTVQCMPNQTGCAGWYLTPSLVQRILGKLSKRDQPGERSKLPTRSDIVITSPLENSVITSPITITGQIPNTWVFEASFPIAILDSQKNEITRVGVQTQGDWMTDQILDFSVTVPFTTADSTGFILIQNDNPSGLPENSKSFLLPIRFK